ncbi:hypothetical protein EV679_0228 [Kerstersia gyiorum]|uniref:Uncharacterized protein n=2 Tax=Kerstersia gyiorum TaxID=206506 RepID=A0A4Q7MWF0_9BURK|nr:hypothetical protein EV679_0228 [Kerstersia gyiorum]
MSGLEIFRMAASRSAALSLCAFALAACGGGDGDDSDIGEGPISTTSQYPAGVWSGKSGDGQTMFGIVDPGSAGVTGSNGNFFFARGGTDETGYDGLYGNWTQSGGRFSATNATYYMRPAVSTGTGSFRSIASVTATVAGRTTAAWNTDSGTMDGRFTSPYSASTFITFGMEYDNLLSSQDSNLLITNGIQGAYRGDTSDGGGWALYVDWAGRLSGRSGNCRFYGMVTPRSDAANSGATSPFYSVSMTLYNDFGSTTSNTCEQAGNALTGTAIVRYDDSYQKSGIWLATRLGNINTYILDGTYLKPGNTAAIPRTFNTFASNTASAATNPIGSWSGTDPFTGQAVNMVVLPNHEYLMYRGSGDGDVLYSITRLGMEGSNGQFYADDALFWRRYNDTIYSGIHFAGTLRNENVGNTVKLRGLYDDPSNNFSSTAIRGLPTATEMSYVQPPQETGTELFQAVRNGGRYEGEGGWLSFGSRPVLTSLTVEEIMTTNDDDEPVGTGRYRIVGDATKGCKAVALLNNQPSSEAKNMFGVDSLQYSDVTEGSCSYKGHLAQNGVLIVDTVTTSGGKLVAKDIRLLVAANDGFTIFKAAQKN